MRVRRDLRKNMEATGNATKKKGSFSGSVGFVLAAAGSAVGLGNLWRFPYLAAKNGGGLFLITYLVLVLTFGFTLLVSEVAIGRKTKGSPAGAYGMMHPKMKWLGGIAAIVPFLILPYYSVIGGWVLKYAFVYLFGQGRAAAEEGFFTDYIVSPVEPVVLLGIFVGLTTVVIYRGINQGIEKISKILMPVLFVVVLVLSAFVLTIDYSDGSVTRTGVEGLMVYVIPNLDGLTVSSFLRVLVDAMGQLFYSISVAMGIMIAYGSYLSDGDDLLKGVKQIEFCDRFVAFMAGVMIIVPLYVMMGREGMNASGPSLLFISMPGVFVRLGIAGEVLGAAFFIMVFVAALTSAISLMEAVVSSLMEVFGWSRKRATVVEGVVCFAIGLVVCLGYNAFYFEAALPNGSTGQILDILDYLSNSILMPVLAIGTCFLVGWLVKPETVIAEATKNGEKFGRKRLFVVMVRFVSPVLLLVLLLQSMGVF